MRRVGEWAGSQAKWLVNTSRRRVAIALIALAALAVMGQLASVLHEMHLPGTVAARVTDLDSVSTAPEEAVRILSSWDAWDLEQKSTHDYSETGVVVGTWLLVDTLVFAPALALLVAGVARGRRDIARMRTRQTAFYATQRFLGRETEAEPTRPRTNLALTQLLDLAIVLSLVYLLFDWLENGLTWWAVVSDEINPPVASAIRGTTIAKVAALVFAIVPILLSYLNFWGPARDAIKNFGRNIIVLRVQVVGAIGAVMLLLYLPGNVRPQLSDLIRSWNAHRALTTVAAAILLGSVILLTGRTAIARAANRGQVVEAGDYGWTRLVVQIAAAGALFAVGAIWGDDLPGVGSGVFLIAFGILLMLWFLTALPTALWKLGPSREPFTCRAGVLTLLAFLPLYALLLAWLRAEVTLGSWGTKRFVVAVAALALVGLWWLLWHAPPDGWLLGAIIAVSAVGLVCGIALPSWPEQLRSAGYRAGSIALVLGALTVVVVGLTLVSLALKKPPRGALAFAGMRTYPLLLTIVALLLATSLLETSPTFYRARILDLDPARERTSTRRPFTLTRAFKAWRGSDSESSGRSWQPLLVVAASGGGARAAYWTLLTLDCLFDPVPTLLEAGKEQPACAGAAAPERAFFAGSGISGGSVGLAMFSALRHGPKAVTSFDPDRIFRRSYVDAVVANYVAVDLPNAVLWAPGWSDRARALEDAWKEEVPQLRRHLFGDRPDSTDGKNWEPLLLLNSAAVEDGCRVSVSTLSLNHDSQEVGEPDPSTTTTEPPEDPAGLPREQVGPCRVLRTQELPAAQRADAIIPATRDLRDIMCRDQDLDYATAALLSARFPYVSPSGAVPFCTDKERFTYLVDGGSVDSSAASTADAIVRSLMPKVRDYNETGIAPCVQPIVVQLDNGYDDVPNADRPSRPKELVAPLSGAIAASTSAAAEARQSLAAVASRLGELSGCAETVPDLPELPTYVRVVPQTHPGIQAPLGWSLSQEARSDMKTQLRGERNQCTLLVVRHWLTGHGNNHGCVAGTVRYKPPTSNTSDTVVGVAGVRFACPRDEPACDGARSGPYGGYVIPTTDARRLAREMRVNGTTCTDDALHVNETLTRGCDFEVTTTDALESPRPSWSWVGWGIVGLAVLVIVAITLLNGRRDPIARALSGALGRPESGT